MFHPPHYSVLVQGQCVSDVAFLPYWVEVPPELSLATAQLLAG